MTGSISGNTNDTGVDIEDLSFLDLINDEVSPNNEDIDETESVAMFEGDIGTLYPEQRRCLHALLKHRYISADRHPEQWATLLTHEELMKSRLNDLFLDLHIERRYQIAFKHQARAESADQLPSLLRDIAHTKEETIVMVYLRQRFFAQRQEGDDLVFIDRQALLDEVADQRPADATHRAMDHKRATNAIAGLATAGVLLKTADPDRFRISPIIEVLMPIEKLRTLWDWLITQNGTDNAGSLDDAADNEHDMLFDPEETD